MRTLLILMSLLFGASITPSPNLKVATISLDNLTALSTEVVIADVTKIESRAGVRVGVAQVIENIGGSLRKRNTIEFVAEPTWTCDISDARVGERVLLFMIPIDGSAKQSMHGQPLGSASKEASGHGKQLYELTHSGRGRIVLHAADAKVWSAIVDRYTEDDAWQLNVNLTVPKKVTVSGVKGNKGSITLDDLVARVIVARKQNLKIGH